MMYAAYLWKFWFLRNWKVYIRSRQEIMCGSGGGDGSVLSPSSPAPNARMGGFSESSAWAGKSWSHKWIDLAKGINQKCIHSFHLPSWSKPCWGSISICESCVTSALDPSAFNIKYCFRVTKTSPNRSESSISIDVGAYKVTICLYSFTKCDGSSSLVVWETVCALAPWQ